MSSKILSARRVLQVWLILACGSGAAAAQGGVPRPPRLASDARSLGRVVRPVQPRTSLAVVGGYTLGDEAAGVRRDQWRWALIAEGAYGRAGLFLELPVVLDTGHGEGLYGPGKASVAGLGDLRFGVDVAILHARPGGVPLTLGAGVQITAPTGGAREVIPEAPFVSPPPVSFGPSLWSLRGGAGLTAGPWRGLSAQLNADMLGLLRDEQDLPNRKEDWLFGALALVISYRASPWLVPMIQLDSQLEILGKSPLRQLVYLTPAARVRIHRRLALDLVVRIPLGSESEAEQRLSAGAVITVGLGRRGEEAW
jgi:hypothetical protein